MSDGSEYGPGPAAWLVRGGEHGEREEMALARGLAIAGWEELGDISDCETREGIRWRPEPASPLTTEPPVGPEERGLSIWLKASA
jgi:hypothetical protein